HPKPGPFGILHVIGPVAKDGEAEVRFAGDAPVDRVLRGRTMIESRAPAGSLAAQPQAIVLASCNGRPVWLAHGVARIKASRSCWRPKSWPAASRSPTAYAPGVSWPCSR